MARKKGSFEWIFKQRRPLRFERNWSRKLTVELKTLERKLIWQKLINNLFDFKRIASRKLCWFRRRARCSQTFLRGWWAIFYSELWSALSTPCHKLLSRYVHNWSLNWFHSSPVFFISAVHWWKLNLCLIFLSYWPSLPAAQKAIN